MIEKPKIVYVDDESINLQMFQFNFRKKYIVLTAENGNQGLEILNNNHDIAAVISDMKMPKMNGIEFIKKAKKIHPDITYFILTGYDITKEIAHALETGLIKKYFSKPFSMREMEASLP